MTTLKKRLASRLTPVQKRRIRTWWQDLLSIPFGGDLPRLARVYDTDKFELASYYQRHLAPYRFRRVTLFEIGVGGYHVPALGGDSLRMWRRYLRRGRIVALDDQPKVGMEERRIRIFRGDQADPSCLERIVAAHGPIDVVVDDGSHRPSDVIATFEYLFPRLPTGALYCIENVQTSYWPDYDGDPNVLDSPRTTLGYFKQMLDRINVAAREVTGYVPTEQDRQVAAMHVYPDLLVLERAG